MPLPPITVIAACGSIITAFKSGWELSRMLKKKDMELRMDQEATVIMDDLQRAYRNGLMSETAYGKWYDRFVVALAEKDGMEIRMVRKHLDLLKAGHKGLVTSKDDSRSSKSDSRSSNCHSYHDDRDSQRRRHSSLDSGYQSSGYDRYEEKPRQGRIANEKYHSAPVQLTADDIARRRYSTNSYALPSPYAGEIEYPPVGEYAPAPQCSNSYRAHPAPPKRTDSGYVSRSSSNADGRGRSRSRSVRPEPRIREESVDSGSDVEEVYDQRRDGYFIKPDYRAANGRQYR